LKKIGFIIVSLLLMGTLLVSGCAKGGASQEMLQIKGSDTELSLVQRMAEQFMQENETKVAVTGGGSGTGIAALINGEVDIANASRPMKDEEVEQAQSNGVEPVPIVVAMDGLSIIAHPDNPVENLTVEQLGAIYRGDITNWADVGGSDQEISLYGRQNNSGTFVFFRDTILKSDYSENMKRLNGNAQIVEGIKTDSAGIGYVGVGYVVDEAGNQAEGLSVVKIAKDENSPYVSPLNKEDVMSGAYPVARALYQYTNGTPEGALLDFIKFELSDQGQEIATKEGFFPVTEDIKAENNNNLQ